MNKAALFFIVAAAVAAGAFFALRTDTSATGAPDTVGLERSLSGSEEAPGPMESPDLGVPDAQAGMADRKEATMAAASAPSLGAGSASASKKVVSSRGEGTLTGRVTDANGAPLDGAVIQVTRGGFGDFFLEEGSEELSPMGAKAESDAGGRFSLTTSAGSIRISILRDGFAPYSSSATIKKDQEDDLGDLRLSAGVILSGRVIDRDGNGIAGAEIIREAESADGITVLGGAQDVAAQTDAGGGFLINRQAAGPYKFFVTHPEHPAGEFQGETERAGETTSGLEVVLQDGVFVRGTVAGLPSGAASGTPEFTVTAKVGSAGDHDFSFPTGPGTTRKAKVEADGSFEVRGLQPSKDYHMTLTKGEGSSWGSRTRRSEPVSVVTPAEGLGPAVQLTYSTGATVSFTVTGADGEPMQPDSIQAGFSYEREWDDAVKDEATGRCELSGLWPDKEGEMLILRLTKKGFADWEGQDLTIYPGEVVDLGTIALVERPSVRVTVLDDKTGEPIVGARVTMAPPKEESNSMSIRMSTTLSSDEDNHTETVFGSGETQSGKTDAQGVVSLDATAGAEVEIRVEDGVHAPSTVGPIDLPEVMAVFEQEVSLAEGGGLRVTALDPSGTPAKGYAVELDGEDMETAAMRSERTGDDGVLSLTGLPAGPARVRLGKRGGGGTIVMPRISMGGLGGNSDDDDTWTEVIVVPGEIVDVGLAAPAIGSLKGSVAELGQALAGADVKLRSSDDDNPFAGMMIFGGGGDPSATSDALGEFHIVDVEAGDYELVVEHPTRAMPYTEEITIEGGEQEVQLDLSVTEVTGVVTDENGEPIAGARVEAERVAEETGNQRTSVRMVMMTDDGDSSVMMTMGDDEAEATTSDAEGRYRLRGVAPGVRLKVNATAKGYDKAESEPFTVADGSIESDVDIQFEKSGSIRIEVEGLSGRALAFLERKDATSSGQPKVQMLDGASTTVDSLEPGEWTVRLQAMGPQSLSADPSSADVNVIGGETAVVEFEIQ